MVSSQSVLELLNFLFCFRQLRTLVLLNLVLVALATATESRSKIEIETAKILELGGGGRY